MKKILFPSLLFFVLACEDDESQNGKQKTSDRFQEQLK